MTPVVAATVSHPLWLVAAATGLALVMVVARLGTILDQSRRRPEAIPRHPVPPLDRDLVIDVRDTARALRRFTPTPHPAPPSGGRTHGAALASVPVGRPSDDIDSLRQDGIVVVAPDGLIRSISATAAAILGDEPERLVHSVLAQLMHPGDVARFDDARDAVSAVAGPIADITVRVRSGERWRHLGMRVLQSPGLGGSARDGGSSDHDLLVVLRDDETVHRLDQVTASASEHLAFVGALLDRARSGTAHESLAHRIGTELRTLVDADACTILRLDDGHLRFVAGTGPGGIPADRARVESDVALARAAADAAAAVGRGPDDDADAAPRRVGDHPDGRWRELAFPIRGRTGVDEILVVERIGSGALAPPAPALLAITADVLALALARAGAEHDARRRATKDALTGLVNREQFADRLATAIRPPADHGRDPESLAVAAIDLDHFALVNDGYGHDVGDQLLHDVAERLARVLRPGDLLARFGGDEFVVLSRRLRSNEDAALAGDRLRAALAEPFDVGGHRVRISASVGVAAFTAPVPPPAGHADHGDDAGIDGPTIAGLLVQHAYAALGQAKAGGRERVETFDPSMIDRAIRRLELERELRVALADDQLRVFYQPVVDVATGETVEVEALVRWIHPGRGMVVPDEFIPVSEATSLIEEIGDWVVDAVAAQISQWCLEGTPLRVSINVSARQLIDAAMLPAIERALRTHGVDPGLLAIELSESALTGTEATALSGALSRLAALGIGIAIDGFGTGTATIGRIRSLPVDTVKLDRGLVAAVATSGADYAAVTCLVGFAKALALRVVAAGVESDQQLELLRDIGCDLAQGYLFSPAIHEVRRDRAHIAFTTGAAADRGVR